MWLTSYMNNELPATQCPICNDVEETCDCIFIGDDVTGEIAVRMDAGQTPTEHQVENMVDLLKEQDLLARRDGGGWMLAEMTDEQFEALASLACMQADPHTAWLDVLEMQRIERNVVGLCSGLEWESFRDGFEPDLAGVVSIADADEILNNAARSCIDAWLARRAS